MCGLQAGAAVLLTQGVLPASFPASAGPSSWRNGEMEHAAPPPAGGFWPLCGVGEREREKERKRKRWNVYVYT